MRRTSSAVVGDDDRLGAGQDLVEARPVVGDDRGAAGGGLEQAHARAVAGGDHVGAGDVEGEAAGRVEARVIGRGEVLDALDVRRPGDVGRVERPGDGEAPVGRAAGRLEEQAVERRLAVGAVGAEVGEVPAGGDLPPSVGGGVDRAVERAGGAGAVVALEAVEGRAAGEGEVEVEAGDEPGREVLLVAGGELGQRHRRVDVVEGGDALRRSLHPGADGDAVGDVGADDDRVGAGDLRLPGHELGRAGVEGETAEAGVGEVAARAGVPGDAALEEGDVVAAGGEGAEQRAVGGGVAVAPGRGEAEAEDDELHAGSLAGASGAGGRRRPCPWRGTASRRVVPRSA